MTHCQQFRDSFEEKFPSLEEVGSGSSRTAFVVFSEAIKTQILDLRQKGKLRFNGNIRVTMHL